MGIQYRIKVKEKFKVDYPSHTGDYLEISHEQQLVAKTTDGGLSFWKRGSIPMFFRDITGDPELHFITLNSSHYESYEQIGEGQMPDQQKYPQYAIRVSYDPDKEFVVAWHEHIGLSLDGDHDYVFRTNEQMRGVREALRKEDTDVGDVGYVSLQNAVEDWPYSSYIALDNLHSVRKVPKTYSAKKNDGEIR